VCSSDPQIVKPEFGQEARRLFAQGRCFLCRGWQSEQRREGGGGFMPVKADHHVVQNAGLAQKADILEGPRQPGPANLMGR